MTRKLGMSLTELFRYANKVVGDCGDLRCGIASSQEELYLSFESDQSGGDLIEGHAAGRHVIVEARDRDSPSTNTWHFDFSEQPLLHKAVHCSSTDVDVERRFLNCEEDLLLSVFCSHYENPMLLSARGLHE